MESVIILNLCNKKSWSYDVCLLRYGVLVDIIFLLFQAIFCFFAPLLTQKIKIWKKCKRTLDILSFYTCVPLIRIIWCMVSEIWSSTGRMFFWSYAIFCPFTPLTPWKMKISKMKKTPGDTINLQNYTKNHDHLYTVPEIWRMMDVIIFILAYHAFFQALFYNC